MACSTEPCSEHVESLIVDGCIFQITQLCVVFFLEHTGELRIIILSFY
jgi:hypothetical protein